MASPKPRKTRRIIKTGWYEPGTRTTRRGLPEKVLTAFQRDVEKLRAKYFEKDEDGDYPVTYEIFDRTYGGIPRYFQIPHLHGLPPREYPTRLSVALRYAHSNVEQAAGELRRIGFEVEQVLRTNLLDIMIPTCGIITAGWETATRIPTSDRPGEVDSQAPSPRPERSRRAPGYRRGGMATASVQPPGAASESGSPGTAPLFRGDRSWLPTSRPSSSVTTAKCSCPTGPRSRHSSPARATSGRPRNTPGPPAGTRPSTRRARPRSRTRTSWLWFGR